MELVTNEPLNHRGTNGGISYQSKCHKHWQSVRFYVDLAYLTEKTYAGAARELNRKRVPTMKDGAKWHAQTVKSALAHYSAIDEHNGNY